MYKTKQDNFYAVLGLDHTATQDDIKKAYRAKALKTHSDRGGEDAKMASLNEAYEKLKDPLSKKEYDASLKNSPDAIDKMLSERVASEYLDSTGERFSQRSRVRYQQLCQKYTITPLLVQRASQNIKPHASTLYGTSENLFAHLYLKMRQDPQMRSIDHITSKRLTPEFAFKIFIDFLEGQYYGQQLGALNNYFSAAILQAEAREKNLYESMAQFITIADKQRPRQEILVYQALLGIKNYIQDTASFSMPYCATLLQNNKFRDLFQWSFINALRSLEGMRPVAQTLSDFVNYPKAREALENTLERQERFADQLDLKDAFEELVRVSKYLYIFEKGGKEMLEHPLALKEAEHHIEYAYQILDWLPALSGHVPLGITVNLLMQAGAHFQLASHLVSSRAQIMACEQMAFDFYIQAVVISQRSSLDVEFYILQTTLNYLCQFNYKIEGLDTIIPELQDSCLYIANVFPLAEVAQSNLDFMDSRYGLQAIMRRLLHTLVGIIKNNMHSDLEGQIRLDHEYVNVLYYAYEACLRQWYEAEDPDTEKNIRATLIEELLYKQHWSIHELNMNLQSPWTLINRNTESWLQPSRTLALPRAEAQAAYCGLDAVEVNYKTGGITFVMRDITGLEPPSERVVTLSDLQELLQHNITTGFLSLDEVDNHMRFHPFNKMRIGPVSLFETDFLKTLLLTDYFLKFITVGHEVNGAFPYLMRPIDQMIAHLPFHLKQIIHQFHNTQVGESAHRFWIEAQNVNVFIPQDDETTGSSDLRQLIVPEIKMVVKKHLLRRNTNGALIDDENEAEEGWQVYLLRTLPNAAALKALGDEYPAIVFIRNKRETYLVQQGLEPEKITLGAHHGHHLLRLGALVPDNTGLIVKTQENSAFLYQWIKTIAQEYKKPHYFSPEYVFAQEFTAHYDEFAEYFPEFARLRELSRMTVFVRLLNGVKETNHEHLSHYKNKLNDIAHWQQREQTINEAVQRYNQQYTTAYNRVFGELTTQLRDIFLKHRNDFSLRALQNSQADHLAKLKSEIGTLDFTYNSPEVESHCEQMYQSNRSSIIRAHGQAAWNHNQSKIRRECDEEKYNIARELTKSKRDAVHKQLLDLYYPVLDKTHNRNACAQLITQYLNNQPTDLVNALAQRDYEQAFERLVTSLPAVPRFEIQRAAQGNNTAIVNIITTLTVNNLRTFRQELDEEIRKALLIPEEEKAQLRSLIRPRQLLENELTKMGIGKQDNVDEQYLQGKCLWVPASVDRQPNRMRLVYGGVMIGPNLNFNRGNNVQSQAAMNTCFSTHNHVAVSYTHLPTASSSSYSNSYNLRSGNSSSSSASSSSGSGGGGGLYRPPGSDSSKNNFYSNAKLVGSYDGQNHGGISNRAAASFSGCRYNTYQLQQDTVLYRAGSSDKALGEYFTFEKPMSELQVRMDSAIRPKWPEGGRFCC